MANIARATRSLAGASNQRGGRARIRNTRDIRKTRDIRERASRGTHETEADSKTQKKSRREIGRERKRDRDGEKERKRERRRFKGLEQTRVTKIQGEKAGGEGEERRPPGSTIWLRKRIAFRSASGSRGSPYRPVESTGQAYVLFVITLFV